MSLVSYVTQPLHHALRARPNRATFIVGRPVTPTLRNLQPFLIEFAIFTHTAQFDTYRSTMENPHGYRAALLDFMSYNDGETYGVDRVFTIDELGGVTAAEVITWFNFKCFGTTTPTLETRPLIRSNTLHFWKKALSYYMPNRNMQWNQITGHGNPTRSQGLNDLIKRVKRFEVRGHGAESKARRPMPLTTRCLFLEINLHNPCRET